MDSTDMECPSTKQWQDWLSSDQDAMPELRLHLQTCNRCSQILASLTDDGELQMMATAAIPSLNQAFDNEPDLEKLRKELRQKLRPWSDSEPPSEFRGSEEALTTDRSALATDEEFTVESPTIDSLNQRLPANRFMVDRLLAKGGAGSVYLAYDQKLQREVAIKVLGRNSNRDRQRFQREARVLAELEHPNVVRVYDVGKLAPILENYPHVDRTGEVEQLYLVLEFVPGGTSASLQFGQSCWQSLVSNSLPSKRTSTEGQADLRLESGRMNFRLLAKLLATAADGLAAAHARNLVHRDVKPSNLLLNQDWTAIKVADFGLARIAEVDRTQVTRTGDLLGTTVFMSPEQVVGQEDISAASDIYSLGATLFQLLTGELPFQGSSAAILRQIVDVAPLSPRLLNPQVPVELEIICQHAMEKEIGSRYATMTQFAEDLRRFSIGEPIQARPVSASKKAIRFLKKNRLFAAALTASTGLLMALTIGSVAAAIVYSGQNIKLAESAKAESEAKLAAEKSLRNAIEAADELLVSVTEDTDLLPRTPGSEEIARKLLKKAQSYYQQLVSSGNSSSMTVAFDEARARSGLAQVANRLGNPAEVEQEANAAIALLDSLPDEAISSTEKTILLTKTLGYLGKSLATRGELKRSIEVMNRSVLACEAELRQSESEDSSSSPNETRELTFLLGESLRLRAVAENMAGNLEQAEATLVQAEAIFKSLLVNHPDDPHCLRKLAGCNSTMAVTLVRRDGYDGAKTRLETANDLLTKLEVEGQLPIRIRPDRATNLVNLAMVEFHLGNHARAKDLFVLAEDEYQQLSILEPSVVDHKYKKVLTVLNSGKIDVAQNQVETILRRYRELEPILNDLLEVDPDSQEYLGTLGMVQGNIAVFLRMLEKHEEAIETLRVSDATLRRYAELIENTPDSLYAIALNQYGLAKSCLSLKSFDEGVFAIQTSMAMTSNLLKDHPDYLPSRMHQVDELIVMCELLEAQPDSDPSVLMQTVQTALATSTKLLTDIPEIPEYEVAHGLLHSSLALANLRLGKVDRAIASANEGIAYLQSLKSDIQLNNVREAYMHNYLTLAKSLGAQWSGLDEGDQQKRADVLSDFELSLEKSREFGASQDELDKLKLLVGG